MTEPCSMCGVQEKEHSGWPDGHGGLLCQLCWEDYCSRTWWETFGTYGAPQPDHPPAVLMHA